MKLIKINTDHYIIVDDSEIKEGDWVLFDNKSIIQCDKILGGNYYFKGDINETSNHHLNNYKKITHSTQSLEYSSKIGKYWGKVQPIDISEVKELIGEVGVEKKARKFLKSKEDFDNATTNYWIDFLVEFYNQALEDNKEKKYTEEDVIRIVEKSRETGLTAEYLLLSIQPKTEWEVEFIDGKIKLV